jgi:hypothetical protein
VKEVEGRSSILFDLSSAPLIFGGLISYNAYNLLAAIAATEAIRPLLPVSQESLVKSLLSFGASPEDNPGHFNLFDLPGGRVVLLAGSNRDSYRRDAEVLARIRDSRRVPVDRIIGVITGVGTHSEDYMRTSLASPYPYVTRSSYESRDRDTDVAGFPAKYHPYLRLPPRRQVFRRTASGCAMLRLTWLRISCSVPLSGIVSSPSSVPSLRSRSSICVGGWPNSPQQTLTETDGIVAPRRLDDGAVKWLDKRLRIIYSSPMFLFLPFSLLAQCWERV